MHSAHLWLTVNSNNNLTLSEVKNIIRIYEKKIINYSIEPNEYCIIARIVDLARFIARIIFRGTFP